VGAKDDAKIILHLSGIGRERDSATEEICRVVSTELMRDDTEEMEARCVVGLCCRDFSAQAFGLAEVPGSKMSDRRRKFLGDSGRHLFSARRLRTPQTKLPARDKCIVKAPYKSVDEVDQSMAQGAI
jgi:hypothetical protein